MAQSSSHTITVAFLVTSRNWIVGGSVRVLTPKDSTLVKGALTDQQGRFRVWIGRELYRAGKLSYKFETIEKSVTLSDKKEYALGNDRDAANLP